MEIRQIKITATHLCVKYQNHEESRYYWVPYELRQFELYSDKENYVISREDAEQLYEDYCNPCNKCINLGNCIVMRYLRYAIAGRRKWTKIILQEISAFTFNNYFAEWEDTEIGL